MSGDDVLSVAGQFYEGILSEQGWQSALNALARVTSSDAVSLVLWDRREDVGIVGEQIGLPSELMADYASHYHLLDPGRQMMDRVGLGEWYIDERDLGLATIQRSEFYADFLQKYALDSTMACPIIRGAEAIDGFLSLSAPKGRRDLVDIATAMRPLVPHIQRAARLRTQLIELAQQNARLQSAFDKVSLALVLVSAKGTVLMVNQSGNKWIPTIQRALKSGSPDQRALLSSFARACDPDAPMAATLKIQTETGHFFVNVVPVNDHSSPLWGVRGAAALLYFSDPSDNLPGLDELLRQLFRLTAAEIRLVNKLREGATLQEAAYALRIAEGTVRTQLKSVFAKLGVRRQAELQRLLGRLEVVRLD
jgi:DNA-binding CsgD family transcriptional regulator/PAS domain-containing protein